MPGRSILGWSQELNSPEDAENAPRRRISNNERSFYFKEEAPRAPGRVSTNASNAPRSSMAQTAHDPIAERLHELHENDQDGDDRDHDLG